MTILSLKDILPQVETVLEKINQDISHLDIDAVNQELEILKQRQSDQEIFSDFEKLKQVNIQIKKLEDSLYPWQNLKNETVDVRDLIEITLAEKAEEEFFSEIHSQFEKITAEYKRLELIRMFQDETDYNNCYLSIHSGAGGTESCDWAMMLYRLYTRWAEKKKIALSIMEYQAGEEVGIKSATLYFKGDYATGLLKSEMGIHRLVRISPFDAAKKRHTSFASVSITPEVEDNISVEINPSDLRIDTYRASGAGGQHVNTTDSAVRITHQPTGIVVSCQAERSQHQNKDRAMKILKAKLYEHEVNLQKEKASKNQAEKKKIEWGSQIRSYVFHPYNMVKDHRTNHETSNVKNVMDGEIDAFIETYLKKEALIQIKKNTVNGLNWSKLNYS